LAIFLPLTFLISILLRKNVFAMPVICGWPT
jgi:hypothetical protein